MGTSNRRARRNPAPGKRVAMQTSDRVRTGLWTLTDNLDPSEPAAFE
jgi:hypothetical protein